MQIVHDHERLGPLLDPLARAAADGDPVAVDLLVTVLDRTRLAEPTIRRLVVDDRVDDVHQDVLVAVAQSVGGFRGGARFTTWLFRVAHNQAVPTSVARLDTTP